MGIDKILTNKSIGALQILTGHWYFTHFVEQKRWIPCGMSNVGGGGIKEYLCIFMSSLW